MAEDQKADESGGGGGSSKKLMILIILAIAVLGAGGGAAWFMMGSGEEETHKTEKKHEKDSGEAHGDEPGPIVELEPFVLNLADREELRYLKISIKLELDRPEEQTDYPVKVPAIRDALLVLLSSKDSHLLRTTNGKRRVRDEILSRANGVMNKGEISNVFFTDFVIQ
ncbi:flagellar basal body-associated FliL family protein [Candidatus Nitrospira salsa]|nr:MAG: flagellar basal body-associated protein FliL [Nitrospirales bacterium]